MTGYDKIRKDMIGKIQQDMNGFNMIGQDRKENGKI